MVFFCHYGINLYMNQTFKHFLHNLLLSGISDDEESELIPVITADIEDDVKTEDLPDELPILAVRNTVLFPGVVLPITVSRKKSVKLVRKAHTGDKIVGVVAQKNTSSDDPSGEDLYPVGTVAKILKMLVLPDGNTNIIIQGQSRFKIEEIKREVPYLTAKVSLCEETPLDRKNKQVKALVQSLKDAAGKMLKLNPEIPQEAQVALDNIDSPSFLTHFLSSNLNVEVAQKQALLEVNDSTERGKQLL